MTLAQDCTWYAEERPRYQQVCAQVEDRVRTLAAAGGADAETHSRAKTLQSFVKKAIQRRYASPRAQTTDLAGVRATFVSRQARDMVAQLLADAYPDARVERKEPSLRELGYSGVHVTVSHDPGDGQARSCEVQLRTAGEDAWNRLSHELLYKPGLVPPEPVARALYLLQALAEVIDNEAERSLETVVAHPSYAASRLLLLAESEYFPRAHADYYKDMSLEILTVVAPLVGEPDAYGPVLHEFAVTNDVKLRRVLSEHAGDPVNVVLTQPESVVLFQLYETDEFVLRDAWDAQLAPDLLDPVLAAWGAVV